MSGQSISRSLAWMGGASLVGQIITWSITIIVARLLSPEDYGLVSISGLFTVFAHSIALMGISAAVVQAETVTEYQIRALYGFSILMGVFMFCLGLLAAPAMAWFFHEPRLVALVSFQNLVFLFGAPKSLQWSILARETCFDLIAKIETGSRILTSACVLVMAVSGFGVWTLAAQWVLIEFFQLVGFSFYRRIAPTFIIRWDEIRELLIFGIHVFLRNSIGQLYASVDIFIFGKFASASFLGAYSFAKQLTNMPFEKIITIINRVLSSYLAKEKGNMESMRIWTLKIADLQALFLAPFFYLLFFCAEETVLILLGENWRAAVLPIQIFCIANVFKLAESYAMLALTALGKVVEQVRFVCIQLVLIGSAIWGVSVWVGAEPSLYVWVTIYPFLSVLFCKLLLNSLHLSFYEIIVHLKKTLVAHGVLGGVLLIMHCFLEGTIWMTLLVKFSVGCTVYLLFLFVVDRQKILDILSIFPIFRKKHI